MVGGKQLGFSNYEQATAKKRTRRERSLARDGERESFWSTAWGGTHATKQTLKPKIKTEGPKNLATHNQHKKRQQEIRSSDTIEKIVNTGFSREQ